MNKNKRNYLLITSIVGLTTILVTAIFMGQVVPSKLANATPESNTLIVSPDNQPNGGAVKTTKGNTIYIKDDGIT